ALALCLMLGSASVWSQTVIAGWTFPGGSLSTQMPATCVMPAGSTATLYANGANGSSTWSSGFSLGSGSTTSPDVCGNSGTSALHLANTSDRFLVFKVSTSNYNNLTLYYDTATFSWADQEWEYSLNGTTYTPIT